MENKHISFVQMVINDDREDMIHVIRDAIVKTYDSEDFLVFKNGCELQLPNDTCTIECKSRKMTIDDLSDILSFNPWTGYIKILGEVFPLNSQAAHAIWRHSRNYTTRVRGLTKKVSVQSKTKANNKIRGNYKQFMLQRNSNTTTTDNETDNP